MVLKLSRRSINGEESLPSLASALQRSVDGKRTAGQSALQGHERKAHVQPLLAAYLLRTPTNTRRLMNAIDSLNAGGGKDHDLGE